MTENAILENRKYAVLKAKTEAERVLRLYEELSKESTFDNLKVGDTLFCNGKKGIFKGYNIYSLFRPVTVDFDGNIFNFTLDGQYFFTGLKILSKKLDL